MRFRIACGTLPRNRLGYMFCDSCHRPNDKFGSLRIKHSEWASNEGERAFEGLTCSVESPTSESSGTSSIGDVLVHTRAISLKGWFGHDRSCQGLLSANDRPNSCCLNILQVQAVLWCFLRQGDQPRRREVSPQSTNPQLRYVSLRQCGGCFLVSSGLSVSNSKKGTVHYA